MKQVIAIILTFSLSLHTIALYADDLENPLIVTAPESVIDDSAASTENPNTMEPEKISDTLAINTIQETAPESVIDDSAASTENPNTIESQKISDTLTINTVVTDTIPGSLKNNSHTLLGDFDIYYRGNLNGQDGWSSVWNTLLIQNETVFDGSHAVKNQNTLSGSAYKEIPLEKRANGSINFKIKIDGNNFSDNQDLFGLYTGIGENFVALFRFANNFNNYSNTLLLSVANSTETVSIGQLAQGGWHSVSIAWRDSDFSIRIKIDNNAWSDWFSSQTTWDPTSSFGAKITLPPANQYGDFYLDNLQTLMVNEESIASELTFLSDGTPSVSQSKDANIISAEFMPDDFGREGEVIDTPVSNTEEINPAIDSVPSELVSGDQSNSGGETIITVYDSSQENQNSSTPPLSLDDPIIKEDTNETPLQ